MKERCHPVRLVTPVRPCEHLSFPAERDVSATSNPVALCDTGERERPFRGGLLADTDDVGRCALVDEGDGADRSDRGLAGASLRADTALRAEASRLHGPHRHVAADHRGDGLVQHLLGEVDGRAERTRHGRLHSMRGARHRLCDRLPSGSRDGDAVAFHAEAVSRCPTSCCSSSYSCSPVSVAVSGVTGVQSVSPVIAMAAVVEPFAPFWRTVPPVP